MTLRTVGGLHTTKAPATSENLERAIDQVLGCVRQYCERKAAGEVTAQVVPDFFPGWCVCMVVTAPGVTVNWLDDQDGRLAYLRVV